MKTSIIVTAVAALTVLAPASHSLPTEAEEAHHGAFRVVKEIRDTLVPAPIVRFVEGFPPIAEPRRMVLQLAQVGPPTPTPPPGPPAGVPGGAALTLSSDGEGATALADMAMSTARGAMGGVFGESKATKRPVIVGADVKSISAIEEDLNVMLRIIDKATGGRDEKTTAMAIDVFSFAGSSSAPRAFYLDGYGAMFLAKVKFSLLAPPKSEEVQTNEAVRSEWERARQEVYGSRLQDVPSSWHEPASVQFDEQRVEDLKNQIIDDLANAVHIRHLKSDESVTIVVQGASNTAVRKQKTVRAGASAGNQYAPNAMFNLRVDAGAPTTMTLRAKKSDVDAFAKGKMKSEEFRKKVSVQVY